MTPDTAAQTSRKLATLNEEIRRLKTENQKLQKEIRRQREEIMLLRRKLRR